MAGWNRRDVIRGGAAALGAAAIPGPLLAAAAKADLEPALPAGLRATGILDALPGKVPLVKLSYRPPNYETPITYFKSLYTPNDAFFVRYHLAGIPEAGAPEIGAATWRLKIGGEAANAPLELSLDEIKRNFEAVELAAVCQCSGNRRGLFQPHVPGVEWGYGAMGNAKWKGARLRDILNKAGVKKGALEAVLNGADGAVLDKTPDFVKSIPVWKALDENVIVAYEMNGQPLPHYNGFPARLIVPGWTATYWTKHVTNIDLVTKPFEGFWVKAAYRIPTGKFPVVERFLSQETEANTPITEMVINSLITSHRPGDRVKAGKPAEIGGIAWDAGYGIRMVEVSTDGGKSWQEAKLGQDAGRFSFRQWSLPFTPRKGGHYELMAKATNRIGQTQTAELIFNPAGYHHNVMHRVAVSAA